LGEKGVAMKINIAISAYNRPEYSQRSLAAIFGAKGFTPEKYRIFCALDCYADGSFNQNVYNIYQFFGVIPDVAEQKRGCNYNVKKALELAWEDNPDFVLMIEDDIIISDDALQYIEWAAEKYKNDYSVHTIGLWGHDKQPSLPVSQKEHGKVMRQNYFTCWGWGTWKDRWEEMLATWTTGDDSHETSWDVIVSSHLGEMDEILPVVSRAYNCGEYGGTHRGRAWPGIVASGLIDPDGDIEYREHPLQPLETEWPVYVILGRFGDIYMVCKQLKQPSIICCMSQFARIVYELFPQHKVFELGAEYAREPEKAAVMAQIKYPNKKVTICQQDGQDPKLVLPFRSFQAFQEYYAQL
jgi:GR25 family glycosyltransferase involved in LPS biosynthesis